MSYELCLRKTCFLVYKNQFFFERHQSDCLNTFRQRQHPARVEAREPGSKQRKERSNNESNRKKNENPTTSVKLSKRKGCVFIAEAMSAPRAQVRWQCGVPDGLAFVPICFGLSILLPVFWLSICWDLGCWGQCVDCEPQPGKTNSGLLPHPRRWWWG